MTKKHPYTQKWKPDQVRIYEVGTTNMIEDPDAVNPENKYRYTFRCKKDVTVGDVECYPKDAPTPADPCPLCPLFCEHNKNRVSDVQQFITPHTPELLNFLEGSKQQMLADPDYEWHQGFLQILASYELQKGASMS